MKRKLVRAALGLLGLAIVSVAVVAVPFVNGTPLTVEQFYTRAMVGLLFRSPMELTDTGILRNFGLRWYEDELEDLSVEHYEGDIAYALEQVENFKRYDRPEGFESEVSYDGAAWLLEQFGTLAGRWANHFYTFEQLAGPHASLARFLTVAHKFEDEADLKAYLARVRAAPLALRQGEARGLHKIEKGFVPPTFILQRVADDARKFGEAEAETHPLVARFDEMAPGVEGVSDETRDRYRAELLDVVSSEVKPAWLGFADRIEALKARASDDAGVWDLPEGDAFYRWALGFFTAKPQDPETLHQTGLSEVERLSAEMWTHIEALGGGREGSLGDALRALNQEPDAVWPSTDEGIANATAALQANVDEADHFFDDAFDLRPSNTVHAKPLPKFRWDSSPPALYEAGPVDGSEPGQYFFNPKYLDETPIRLARTISAHEAIPGHHFHIFVTRQQDMPLFRKTMPVPAVTEGWGLYAEVLAAERGYYKTHADKLGHLESLLFRAVRLVVDTGIHHKRWTREQALEYMVDNLGFSEGLMAIELDRYCAWPGQATSYYTGLLELLRLRDKAKAKLGERFELKDFHHVIMTSGALPWSLIERRIDRWLETGEAQ